MRLTPEDAHLKVCASPVRSDFFTPSARTLKARLAVAFGGSQVYVVGRAGAHNENSRLIAGQEVRARGGARSGFMPGQETRVLECGNFGRAGADRGPLGKAQTRIVS